MVSKGQFLERPTLIPSDDGVLEAMSHRGTERPALLVLPPSDEGGGMDHVVVAEIVWAAVQQGHPTLRFNYRGIGASQGEPGDVEAKLADAKAGLGVLSENVGGGAVAAVSLGGSAGVLARLASTHPEIAGVCFVSPVDVALASLASLSVPALVVLGHQDQRLPRAELLAALERAGGQVELIPGADASFQKNLNQVGRSVAEWMHRLCT